VGYLLRRKLGLQPQRVGGAFVLRPAEAAKLARLYEKYGLVEAKDGEVSEEEDFRTSRLQKPRRNIARYMSQWFRAARPLFFMPLSNVLKVLMSWEETACRSAASATAAVLPRET